MDIRRDQLHHQLDELEQADAAIEPRWRDALLGAIRPLTACGGSEPIGLPRQAMAPSRRQIFRIGGSVVLGSAVIAACTNPKKDVQLAQTGTLPPSTTSTTRSPAEVATQTITWLRVAQSVELLALDVYRELIPKAANTAVADALTRFSQHHTDHNRQLGETINELGGQLYTQPNPVLAKTLQESRDSLTAALDADPESAQKTLIKMAIDLEDLAAQTYTYTVGVFTVPELRRLAASIAGAEARHVAVLLGIQNEGQLTTQVPFPFEKTSAAVKEGDAVDQVGAGNTSSVRLPSTTTTVRPATTSTTGPTGTRARGAD
ncbi:MAG: ferritin-like domain-containing protein [Acidimicrobiales bacterium]|nr:ferritin-like domain-containing protein [Acidimicrobiales bacterium]